MLETTTFGARKTLSIFSLVMINVIAVDSLRTLTMGSVYGFSLIFYYLLAALFFFVPTILVTAELATRWPQTGGVYVWVREAFGTRWAFLTIWLQWIYNVVWYPTIFAFIAATLAYLINPHLAANKYYMVSVTLVLFWVTTAINCLGIKASSRLSTLGALLGTLLPMLLIIGLSVNWIMVGKPLQITISWQTFFPSLNNLDNLAFLTSLLFGLMGMEMSAVHAGDVRNPQRGYPRALAYSSLLILASLVLASLAIVIVIPPKQISLVSGLVDAFTIFFAAHNLQWFMPIMILMIVLGSLSGASAWILGPARGLSIACSDSQLPAWLQKTNGKNMPVGILLLQATIFTLLSGLFLLMPTVNSSYWLLSNLTAQLALLFYLMMFAAAIRLRYKTAVQDETRTFKIPGRRLGIWVVSITGMLACVITFFIGFLPPSQVTVGSILRYEVILIIGILIFCIPAFLISGRRKVLKITVGS